MATLLSRPFSSLLTSSSSSHHHHHNLFRFLNSTYLTNPRTTSHAHFNLRYCTSSFTAKPSSELNKKKKKKPSSIPDEKLRSLRDLFSKPGVGIDAYIIPSQDAHQSEFIAECYMRRTFVSGFTGSAGTAVVTKDKAALWTDARYFLQAEKQLNPNWILMRAGNFGVPSTTEWLNDVLAPGCKVGIDPYLFSFEAAEELKEAIAKKNLELVYIYDSNLVDDIWNESRPKPPRLPIRVHDLKYAGVDVASKLSSLRTELDGFDASAIVISMLDEIAWLLNLRGSDVPRSPVMYAYLIVEISVAKLFIDDKKVTPEVMEHLKTAGIELRPYESILSEIESLALSGANLWMDTTSLNAAIVNTYKSACDRRARMSGNKNNNKSNGQLGRPTEVRKYSPISMAKAIKNHAELEGMQNSHLRDAAALARFWAWLEEKIHEGVLLTEVDVADRLLEFRKMQAGFMDTSFDTISGKLLI